MIYFSFKIPIFCLELKIIGVAFKLMCREILNGSDHGA
jgi:hypothetical protein